jgi:N-glycosylase/DNA lyase
VSTLLRLPLVGPAGEPVDLARTLNSHGFADLAPLTLDERATALSMTLRLRRGRPRRVTVRAPRSGAGSVATGGPRRPSATIEVLGSAALSTAAREEVKAGVRHVLRMDQDLSGFYATVRGDPDLAWAAEGAGRMLRSPTVFEDVIKTVCTTNCTWSATVRMVNALVTHLGEPPVGGADPLTNAFPTPGAMASAPETFYREVARAGYRGASLIAIATAVAEGGLDLVALAAPERSDAEVEEALLALPGVGPYAAAHIMMTIGRNSRLILDSWTRPTYARLIGRTTPPSDASIERRFRRYGKHAGLAFWLFVTRDWVSS